MLLGQAQQLDKENVNSGGWRGFVQRVMYVMNRSNYSQQKSLIETIKKTDATTVQANGQTIAVK